MADATQSFATHRRFFPLFHFIAIPLLVINLVVRVIYAWMHRGARLVKPSSLRCARSSTFTTAPSMS